jgi:hypothetical protein
MKIKTRLLKAMAKPEVIHLLFEISENEKKKQATSLKERERLEASTISHCNKISDYIARNLKLQ